MTDQPILNPRFEVSDETVRLAADSLRRLAGDSDHTTPTADVVIALREAGIPVSVRGDAPVGTVIPQRAIQRAARELAWLEADRADVPAAVVLEALAGVGIPVRVGSEPVVSELEATALAIPEDERQALAVAIVDEIERRRQQKQREAGQKAVDLLAALGKLGRAMEDPAPTEVMLGDLVDPAVRGCDPDCPCRGGEPGARWDGEHDPAAEDAVLAAETEREV